MPLSLNDLAELERLGAVNVRERLINAGPGGGSVVPGLGDFPGMTRSDVEQWLAEKDCEATKLQLDTLWWAKAAAWIAGTSILVSIVIAAASYVWPSK